MKVLFNPFNGLFEMVPVIIIEQETTFNGELSFATGDLSLDTGDRTNDGSTIDNGDRVIDTLV